MLRRAFRVPPGKPTANLRQALQTLYRFRDMAVHPSGSSAQVVLHPDLHQGTDWRFVAFSYENAVQLVWIAVGFTHSLGSRTDDRDSEAISAFRIDLHSQLEDVSEDWTRQYGDIATNPGAESA